MVKKSQNLVNAVKESPLPEKGKKFKTHHNREPDYSLSVFYIVTFFSFIGPAKLHELNLEAFAQELERQGLGKKLNTLYDIRSELHDMYKDFRYYNSN